MYGAIKAEFIETDKHPQLKMCARKDQAKACSKVKAVEVIPERSNRKFQVRP